MYAKIFRQIFDSSIAENPELRFTLMDLLVLADSDGVVDMTHEAIARTTNRPLEVIRKTLLELEGPDLRSRTSDANGARIKRLDDHRDWGWVIINFDRFRATATDSQYREKTRLRVQKHRQNIRETSDVALRNVTVTKCNARVTPPYASASASASAQKGDARGRMKPPSLDEVKLFCAKAGIPEPDAVWFWNKEEGNGWTNGGKPVKRWGPTLTAWKAAGYLPSQKPRPGTAPQPEKHSMFEKESDALCARIMKEANEARDKL